MALLTAETDQFWQVRIPAEPLARREVNKQLNDSSPGKRRFFPANKGCVWSTLHRGSLMWTRPLRKTSSARSRHSGGPKQRHCARLSLLCSPLLNFYRKQRFLLTDSRSSFSLDERFSNPLGPRRRYKCLLLPAAPRNDTLHFHPPQPLFRTAIILRIYNII